MAGSSFEKWLAPLPSKVVAGECPPHETPAKVEDCEHPDKKVIRPRKSTDCGHPDRPHHALGKCGPCYWESRHAAKVGKRAVCHPRKAHHAKGLCAKCYDKAKHAENESKRVPECGHPDRPHHAQGKCLACHKKAKRAVCHPSKPHVARGMCGTCHSRYLEKKREEKRLSMKEAIPTLDDYL